MRSCARWRRAFAPIVSRQTSFGSTSTIRTATGRSRSTRRPSNLRGLATDMRRQGFQLVTITDLHVAHAPNEDMPPSTAEWPRPFPQEGGRQPVRRAGLAGTVGLPRLHPPGQPGMVGRPVQGLRRRRDRRILERHERAGDLRDADQDDAAGYGARTSTETISRRAPRATPRRTTSMAWRTAGRPTRAC